jgi:hypothetical protein
MPSRGGYSPVAATANVAGADGRRTMLLIRDRDEMKRHLTHRLEMLEAQRRANERGPGGHHSSLEYCKIVHRMEGIREALELIGIWENHDYYQAFAGALS